MIKIAKQSRLRMMPLGNRNEKCSREGADSADARFTVGDRRTVEARASLARESVQNTLTICPLGLGPVSSAMDLVVEHA